MKRSNGAIERLLEALAAEPAPPTTVREPQAAAQTHVADSLTGLAAPELAGAGRIADMGSGAGFPGLVLALALPEAQVDLIESAERKCAVIERLGEASGGRNRRPVSAPGGEGAAGGGGGRV